MEKNKCYGCGVPLQSSDSNAAGFISKEHFETGLCARCYAIKNRNAYFKISENKTAYLAMLEKLVQEKAFIVYTIDAFLNLGSFIEEEISLLKKSQFCLCVNKIDLLPKSMKEEKIIRFVKSQCLLQGIKPQKVILTSATHLHTDLLWQQICQSKANKVYFVGPSNAGKSSLINAMAAANHRLGNLTVSSYPGSTQALAIVKFSSNLPVLMDTPSLYLANQVGDQLTIEDYKVVFPKGEIRPRSYQLDAEQSLIIGGFACLTYVVGETNSLIAFFANTLEILRSKMAKAKTLFPERVEELFKLTSTIVCGEEKTFEINTPSDIIIAGLGFVAIKKVPATIKVLTLKDCEVAIRASLIG